MRWPILVVLLLSLAAACGKKSRGGSGKPRVAVSIFPIYDVTRRIAGDRLEVLLVLPAGKSEHGYDPTPKEIARLEGAKLGIAVGLDMDGWVENIMTSAGGAKIVRIGDKVKTIPIDVEPIEEGEGHEHEHEKGEKHDDHEHEKGEKHDEHGHEHGSGSGSAEKREEPDDDHDHEHKLGAPDPHFWLDPDRMTGVADAIAAELAAVDPAGKDTFTKNAEAFKASLETLDGAIATRSKAWTKRTIVTFHGSMAYFAKRYNIRIAAVVEPIAGKEPTATYIAEVIGAIKRNKAAALFTEPQLDRAPGETIAREAGIPLGELDPVGGTTGRDSYEALLTWNTDQLEKALK
jgi:zinc transport system substrate-binding protein